MTSTKRHIPVLTAWHVSTDSGNRNKQYTTYISFPMNKDQRSKSKCFESWGERRRSVSITQPPLSVISQSVHDASLSLKDAGKKVRSPALPLFVLDDNVEYSRHVCMPCQQETKRERELPQSTQLVISLARTVWHLRRGCVAAYFPPFLYFLTNPSGSHDVGRKRKRNAMRHEKEKN